MFDTPRVSELKTELRDAKSDLLIKQGLHAVSPTTEHATNITRAQGEVKRLVILLQQQEKRS